jgi:hypothetical protein
LKLPPKFKEAVADAVMSVTANWTCYQKKLEKSQQAADREEKRWSRSGDQYISQKDAAEKVIEQAYLKARGPTPSPVDRRQVMYAARDQIQTLSGKTLDGNYFGQTLLPDFMREHPELTRGWDILSDERGHFEEPHGGARIGIGTASVRNFLRDRDAHVFKAVLFNEKEGFDTILKTSQIPARYDLALMSSKGMSSTSARTLIEDLSREGVTILCMHDFDVSGMTILSTSSRDTDRYEFARKPEVIDMGLRLMDVLQMGLASEAVEIKDDPTKELSINNIISSET